MFLLATTEGALSLISTHGDPLWTTCCLQPRSRRFRDTEPTTGESDQQGRCHRQYASNTPTEREDWESHPHWYPEAGQQHGTKAAEFDIQPTGSWWHHEYHCCPRNEHRRRQRRPREQEQLHSDDGCGAPAFNTCLTDQQRIRQGTNQDSSCTDPHRLHGLLSPTQPCTCLSTPH